MLIMNAFNMKGVMAKFALNIKKFDSWYELWVAFLLCAVLMGCAGMGGAAAPPSPEVQRLINKYRIDNYTLDVALMPPWTASSSIPARRESREMYRLPQERVSLEAYIFDVYYDRAQGMFWVKRTSPAASLEEIYGPIRLSELP